MYNHEAWGDERFRYGPCTKNVADVVETLSLDYDFSPYQSRQRKSAKNCPKESRDNSTASFGYPQSRLGFDLDFSETCDICRNPISDPDRSEMVLYLHAYRYKGTDWEFKSALPSWSKLDCVS